MGPSVSDLRILRPPPPLVGISSTFHPSWSELRRIARALLRLDPSMDIVAGGAFIHAHVLAEHTSSLQRPMERYGIRYILHGFNSEMDLRDLLLARRQGLDFDRVANLAYLEQRAEGAVFRVTGERWNPPLLDDVPDAWHRLNVPFVHRTVQFRTSVGCPFHCAFCSYPAVAHGFHVMSLERLESSLQSLLQIPGIERVVFVDDTFNVPRQRFEAICRIMRKHGVQWYSFLRVQFVDDELAKMMRESGCQAVYLGIESANDVVLRNMNKKATRNQFERGVAALRKHGVQSIAAFVLGFPGETEASIRDNVDFIESSGVEYYTLKDFYFMRHTPIYRDREKYSLTGAANKWSHSTMNSQRAYEFKLQTFMEVSNATFVDPDTSLWHLVLLQDAGLSLSEISTIQRLVNRIMSDQIRGSFDDNHPAFDELRRVLRQGGPC